MSAAQLIAGWLAEAYTAGEVNLFQDGTYQITQTALDRLEVHLAALGLGG